MALRVVKGSRSWLHVLRGRDQSRLAKLPKQGCADPATLRVGNYSPAQPLQVLSQLSLRFRRGDEHVELGRMQHLLYSRGWGGVGLAAPLLPASE